MYHFKKNSGVTLIEILLLSVIISIMILISIGFEQKRAEEARRNRAVAQIQQLLNASLSFFLKNGSWPSDFTSLRSRVGLPFLPAGSNKNPWGNDIIIARSTDRPIQNKLYIYTLVGDSADAAAIAGKLPYGYTTANISTIPPNLTACTKDCYVVTSIDVPGWNLSNANAVNFASLYRNGGCVPVPVCPVDKNGVQMTAQIFVVPASATGANDGVGNCTIDAQGNPVCQNFNAYPLSSFTAFATGPTDYVQGNPNSGPPTCNPDTSVPFYARQCVADQNFSQSPYQRQAPSGRYWRACLSITTEKGLVKPTLGQFPNPGTRWGRYTGSILAIVRCQPKGENVGSDFSVWTR